MMPIELVRESAQERANDVFRRALPLLNIGEDKVMLREVLLALRSRIDDALESLGRETTN